MGCSPPRCRNGIFDPLHSYADADPRLHKGSQNRTITHCLHRKESSACRKQRKTKDIGPATSHLNASILLTLLSSSSSRSAFLYWASLFCSHPSGHCRVYGGRAPRCDRTVGRPYHYCQVQLSLLCGPGACITCYYVLNSTADIFNRHTCIFSSETRAWRAATTRVR